MISVPTFWATIYVGFHTSHPHSPNDEDQLLRAKQVCGDYCNEVGLCVTLTQTRFIYTNGHEPGVAVGLIHYPRFPSQVSAIKHHAQTLAEQLRVALQQKRVSVVFPDETVMLGEE